MPRTNLTGIIELRFLNVYFRITSFPTLAGSTITSPSFKQLQIQDRKEKTNGLGFFFYTYYKNF